MTNKSVDFVNSINWKVLAIGGVVVIGAVAVYEFFKGTTQTSSAGATTSSQQQNPQQQLSPTTQTSGAVYPSFTLPYTSTSAPSVNPYVRGSSNYTITSVYAPYNSTSNTSLYAPTTTTSNETTSTYAPYNYSATSTANNQKYQYSTGQFGTLNLNSPHNFGGTIT